MGRSQWSTATAWHETALPVPVQAAAIIGESMDETNARITVMDTDRRMLLTALYLYFNYESNQIQSSWIGKIVKLFNPNRTICHSFHLHFSATLI